MAKSKIQAGAEIDLLTRAELEQVLANWRTEQARGVKLRRHSILGTSDAAGGLQMGGNEDGPSEGMAWAVTRFSVAFPHQSAMPALGLSVFANDTTSPTGLIVRTLLTDVFTGDHGCVLLSGDSLRIAGAGLPVSTQCIVTCSVKELPIGMIWNL
jgi:hypothetical protein